MTSPVWGCPYHGLVEGGKLKLSNGKTLNHPHKYVDSYPFTGSTMLVKHPLAEAVERTEEEAADDAERGWQWWDRAIIGGGQLHGGQLYGWIYIDPDGACWRVTFNFVSADWSIKLDRFGVLSGKPESYTYPVAQPNLGQDTPAVTQPPGTDAGYAKLLHHATVTGDRAAIELAMDFGAEQPWRYRPVGWLEVSLKGKGAECQAALTTVYTRAQTLGAASETLVAGQASDWYLDNDQLINGKRPADKYLIDHQIRQGTESRGFSGWVVGIYYDPDGTRRIWKLSMLYQRVLNIPALEHEGPTSFPNGAPLVGKWTLKYSVSDSLRAAVSLDGTEVVGWSISTAQQLEETTEFTGDSTSTYQSSSKGQANYSTGEAQTINDSATLDPGNRPITMGGIVAASPSAVAAVPGDIPYCISNNASSWLKDGQSVVVRMIPHRISYQMYGAALAYGSIDQGETHWHPDVATPSGLLQLPTIDSDASFFREGGKLYGSWCPVTFAATRSYKPVCYI